MAAETIYTRPQDELFAAATISGTAPQATYDLTTLQTRRPDRRVRYSATTVNVHWDLDAAARGDVFGLIVSNIDPSGSPALAVLSNDQGLSVPLVIPAMPASRIPKASALDLTEDEPTEATRISDSWDLDIVSNSANVVLGGAIVLYSEKFVFDPDLRFGFAPSVKHAALDTQNEYLARYIQDYETQERALAATIRAIGDSQVQSLADWFDACGGVVHPSLLWPREVPGLNDPLFGTLADTFVAQQVEESGFGYAFDVPINFRELSHGKPV